LLKYKINLWPNCFPKHFPKNISKLKITFCLKSSLTDNKQTDTFPINKTIWQKNMRIRYQENILLIEFPSCAFFRLFQAPFTFYIGPKICKVLLARPSFYLGHHQKLSVSSPLSCVIKAPENGGKRCPSLRQKRGCLGNKCHSHHDRRALKGKHENYFYQFIDFGGQTRILSCSQMFLIIW
jgi:hypothetical protein